MTEIKLSKIETKLLLDAAAGGGAVEFPESTKPSTRERTIGRLLRDGLAEEQEGTCRLTSAGYRAVGLRPSRAKRAVSESKAPAAEPQVPRATKGALILEMLGRDDGASVPELMAATAWLRHTTRAALSRVRLPARLSPRASARMA